LEPDRINNVEVARGADVLDRWRGQTNALDLEQPRHVAIQRYDATDGGPLF